MTPSAPVMSPPSDRCAVRAALDVGTWQSSTGLDDPRQTVRIR